MTGSTESVPGKPVLSEPRTTPAAVGALLEVDDLVVTFPIRSGGLFRRTVGAVQAVSGVSLRLNPGETLGLVGESGSGKSTTGRAILQLQRPTSGTVRFDGQALVDLPPSRMRPLRQQMQIVFQDPQASLDPKMPVNDAIAEPLRVHGLWRRDTGPDRVAELLRLVGLNPEHGNRYPHEFSGGQRQRVGIARALALEPKMIILDEPVSALDVSVQAGIINLLQDLQEQLGVAYLFIAHDLSVVRHISHRVAVMYLGHIVETGPTEAVYDDPWHPYTKALLSAVPEADPVAERSRQRILLSGEMPSPADPPSGCRFRTRCWKAEDVCATEAPPLIDAGDGRAAACYFPEGRGDRSINAGGG